MKTTDRFVWGFVKRYGPAAEGTPCSGQLVTGKRDGATHREVMDGIFDTQTGLFARGLKRYEVDRLNAKPENDFNWWEPIGPFYETRP